MNTRPHPFLRAVTGVQCKFRPVPCMRPDLPVQFGCQSVRSIALWWKLATEALVHLHQFSTWQVWKTTKVPAESPIHFLQPGDRFEVRIIQALETGLDNATSLDLYICIHYRYTYRYYDLPCVTSPACQHFLYCICSRWRKSQARCACCWHRQQKGHKGCRPWSGQCKQRDWGKPIPKSRSFC